MEFADFFEALTECPAVSEFTVRQGWNHHAYDCIVDAIIDGQLDGTELSLLEDAFDARNTDWATFLERVRVFFVSLMVSWEEFVRHVNRDPIQAAGIRAKRNSVEVFRSLFGRKEQRREALFVCEW